MRVCEKILMKQEGLLREGPVTIAAFGDSVTHGVLLHEINYETVYWNLLRKKIQSVNNYMPVNVINAGVEGTSATGSVERLDRQVLIHRPDLVIVCFGLNDVNGTLEDYLNSLRTIFGKCKNSGSDVIFLTPNMLNTYVAEDTLPELKGYAAVTAEYQNSGRMDRYIYSAVRLAEEKQVAVCDCYTQWKRLSEIQDTTLLLANRINHPIAEMHELFAASLFETIFGS